MLIKILTEQKIQLLETPTKYFVVRKAFMAVITVRQTISIAEKTSEDDKQKSTAWVESRKVDKGTYVSAYVCS